MYDEKLEPESAIEFSSEEERRAALKFFNAAFRAEESGLRQAHELSDEVRSWDPELAEVLKLYGDEEGWHRELLTGFLTRLGGGVQPMGRGHAAPLSSLRARRAHGNHRAHEPDVRDDRLHDVPPRAPQRARAARAADAHHPPRDESFHVPLNVHFLRRVLARTDAKRRRRLRSIHRLLFVSLVALPLASRPKARAFDGLSTLTLSAPTPASSRGSSPTSRSSSSARRGSCSPCSAFAESELTARGPERDQRGSGRARRRSRSRRRRRAELLLVNKVPRTPSVTPEGEALTSGAAFRPTSRLGGGRRTSGAFGNGTVRTLRTSGTNES